MFFFHSQKLVLTIEYHQTIILLSNCANHEVSPWKIVWVLFFNKGLIRHLIIWKNLHFKTLTQIWLSKVKGPALPKERWRKGYVFFPLPKVGAHNRVPSKQLYYWVTVPIMRYPLEKIVWVLFLNKGLIRHLIIWKALHFKALTQIWFSKVKGPALSKERWRKDFAFFFTPKSWCSQ